MQGVMAGTARAGKMATIEASRGIAALIVLLMHAANLMEPEHFSGHIGMGRIFDFGYVGVDYFFVLSGFIITFVHYPEIGQIGSLPRYLWRRVSRIFPIYWAILLLSIVVTSGGRLLMGKPIGFEIGLEDIAGTVFLVMGMGEPKYVGVAWSLQYEMMFYLAFCLLLASARVGFAAFMAWGVYVLARIAGVISLEVPLLDSPHCLEFLMGVSVGVFLRRREVATGYPTLIAVLGAFILAVLLELYGPFGRHAAFGRLLLGAASAAVLIALVGLDAQRAPRVPAWLVRLGSVSYSVYLGHILFVSLAYMFLLKLGLYRRLPEALVYVSAVGGALVATISIGTFVELPLVAVLKGLRVRKVGAAAREGAA